MIEYISILSYFSPFFYNILPRYREGSFFLFGFSHKNTPQTYGKGQTCQLPATYRSGGL